MLGAAALRSKSGFGVAVRGGGLEVEVVERLEQLEACASLFIGRLYISFRPGFRVRGEVASQSLPLPSSFRPTSPKLSRKRRKRLYDAH